MDTFLDRHLDSYEHCAGLSQDSVWGTDWATPTHHGRLALTIANS